MSENFVKTTHHIVGAFDNELKELSSKILEMADKVLEMLEFSRRALDTPSDELTQQARELDWIINDLDADLQNRATRIMALRQPMGVDLRFVVSTLKIASSLERMGDLAKASCRKSSRFVTKSSNDVNNDLKEMNAHVTKMLNDVVSAFRDMDISKANEVLEQDNKVDDVYHRLLKDVQIHVEKNPDAIPAFADIIFTAKNLERIGDHCTKLSDHVRYIATGEMVSKTSKKEAKKKKRPEA